MRNMPGFENDTMQGYGSPGSRKAQGTTIQQQWGFKASDTVKNESLGSILDQCRYHLVSIWLFSVSDIKTIIVPKTVFGIFSALAAPSLGLEVDPMSHAHEVWRRAPLTAFWVWINLIPLDISNQRQPSSVEEDRINKPWRNLPSGRMTLSQARNLMLVLYLVAVSSSWKIGGLTQSLTLIVLGYWYNNIGGSDASWASRNLLNTCGYICFSSGAMEVALGYPLITYPKLNLADGFGQLLVRQPGPTSILAKWFCLVTAAVFSSVHSQDMHDQEGDSARGRKTLPLVIGDVPARWTIGIAVAFWSWACLDFWEMCLSPYAAVVGLLGLTVIGRMWAIQTTKGDKRTYLIYNIWLTSIYSLPVVKYISHDRYHL